MIDGKTPRAMLADVLSSLRSMRERALDHEATLNRLLELERGKLEENEGLTSEERLSLNCDGLGEAEDEVRAVVVILYSAIKTLNEVTL